MRADDQQYYVVKFQNNPQHIRVLANELLVSRLAERVGLPVPRGVVIEVGDWLVANTNELHMQLSGDSLPCRAGLQFGSTYAVDPTLGQVFDYLPEPLFERVRNLDAFAGILAFDKWVCNSDSRQAVFYRLARERKYTAVFIDHGHCFNHGEWDFPDSPLRGVYAWNAAYAGVAGWKSFQPWLERIEQFDERIGYACAEEVPPEWYGGDTDIIERLMARLISRRPRVKELLSEFRDSSRVPFPEWKSTKSGKRKEEDGETSKLG